MRLIEALVPESINQSLRSKTKDDLFSEMVALLKRNPTLAEIDDSTILKVLNEREKTATTGVGKEVGIPHGKIMGLDGICAAIGVSKRGVEYGSVDGLPVRFVVAMVAPPEQSQAYLRILAYSISSFLGGIGGAIFVAISQSVYPSSFTVTDSINFMLNCFLGGLGYVFGPMLGTLVLYFGWDLLFATGKYQLLIFSSVLIFLMVVLI